MEDDSIMTESNKDEQVVLLTLFRLDGWKAKWWAFKSMQFGHRKIKKSKGLSFYRLLGSGADNGFGIKPNFSVYGLLTVWNCDNDLSKFKSSNPFYNNYKSLSTEHLEVYLQPVQVHGLWGGEQPFKTSDALAITENDNIAVITRATIKLRFILKFWKYVPDVSKSIYKAKGRKLSIGVGEWPLVQQATFSIWDSEQQMKEYAYKSQLHNDVIKKTREWGWYKEEMFSRFRVKKIQGVWSDLGGFKN